MVLKRLKKQNFYRKKKRKNRKKMGAPPPVRQGIRLKCIGLLNEPHAEYIFQSR